MAQDFSKAFYDSKMWHSARTSYLASVGGLCEDCLKMGIYTPAVVVHHITALSPENISNPQIATAFSNLKAVCRACHNQEHSDKRFIFSPDGKLIPK